MHARTLPQKADLVLKAEALAWLPLGCQKNMRTALDAERSTRALRDRRHCQKSEPDACRSERETGSVRVRARLRAQKGGRSSKAKCHSIPALTRQL
ncbi:hypothetical protein NDU88_005863 [Pleurodeles waltl]|uniref:Uncharacterized protein n=1 Tax=Pleurodeles waltl TaxID=8319 RepID=A0AAV7QJ46_PLEWA|nr:hypothetical protein NDU88_005863 [Pleurodeles waltl]